MGRPAHCGRHHSLSRDATWINWRKRAKQEPWPRFLTVDAMRPTTLSSCHRDFTPKMDHTLEPTAKIVLSPLNCFGQSILLPQQKETKTSPYKMIFPLILFPTYLHFPQNQASIQPLKINVLKSQNQSQNTFSPIILTKTSMLSELWVLKLNFYPLSGLIITTDLFSHSFLRRLLLFSTLPTHYMLNLF